MASFKMALFLGILIYATVCMGHRRFGDFSEPEFLADLEKYLQPDFVGVDTEEPAGSAKTLKKFRCDRPCVEGGKPRICYYRFNLETYNTLGKACGDCPRNLTQCSDPQCVTADGFERGILTVNRRLPGPSIQVCKGDRVIVDVKNLMPGRSTSIHWHGILQRGTPYSDGVPMVTQCPINEGATFRYDFHVPHAGTMFWHSHDGFQKVDGIVGSLVVREPRVEDPNWHLYDHDLPYHVILVTDWFHVGTEEKYPGLQVRELGHTPDNFLVNGKGRLNTSIPVGHARSSLLRSLPVPTPKTEVPLSIFRVIPGERFRFRLIGAMCLACSVQMSIEKHSFLLVATDGTAVEPVLLDSIIFSAGERYDIVIDANQPVSTYWIHMKGTGACSEWNVKHVFQLAMLQYIGSSEDSPPSPLPTIDGFSSSQSVTLNPSDLDCGAGSNGVCIDQLISVQPVPAEVMAPEPTLRIALPFGFHIFSREDLFQTDSYQRYYQTTSQHRVFVAMFNNISNTLPSSPILSQREDIPLQTFCADGVSGRTGCPRDICECFQQLTLPLGAVVELLFVDDTPTIKSQSQPFHIHGYMYRVMLVKLFTKRTQNARQAMKQFLSGTLQLSRSHAPTAKDTISVPGKGYAVVRFVADNPGYWMLHCHFLIHQVSGMSLVVQVGEPSDMPPVPVGFPRCGDYLPAVHTHV